MAMGAYGPVRLCGHLVVRVGVAEVYQLPSTIRSHRMLHAQPRTASPIERERAHMSVSKRVCLLVFGA